MRRRHFLVTAGAATLAVRGLRLFAAPAAEPRFLLVFLRGGYDCANVLVPYSSSFYYEARPTLAIPRPDAADPLACSPLDAAWGLHPALSGPLGALWERGEAAFVPFCGTDDLSRSHFETQDSIEAGEPLDGARVYGSGFLNRLAGVLTGSSAISFTDGLPLVMQGQATIPNLSLKPFSKAVFDDRQVAILAGMYRGLPLEASVAEGLQLRKEAAKDYEREQAEADRSAVSSRGFEQEARRMARMMRERFGIGFVDVGGWDTHVNETAVLNANLENLGKGLSAYAEELGAAVWGRTVVVVLSEFGRTFRENGTKGTDHGHGSVLWVLGGAVHGRRIAGEQVPVRPETLFQNRDFPVLNEYRSVLGGLLRRLYGLEAAPLDQVFPRAAPRDLGLL